MTVVAESHEAHGATFSTYDGRRVVDHYGRPARTHRAVRNGVGAIEAGYGVVEVRGDDRVDFVDNAVSNRVPAADGRGVYALLLDPQGRVETDVYALNAGERLLLFTPPGRAAPLAEDWAAKTFVQDVEVEVATDRFGVFGVHGPTATEKVASVLNGSATPDEALTFVRGSMGDAGVSVIRGDGLTGEEGYEVVCSAEDAPEVWDTLLTRGMNAVPFGHRTWDTLTLEAGTPRFETELRGRVPNVLGVRNALDFEKGCYVGQEVVSRVENRGRPSRRLVGLSFESDAPIPAGGADVSAGGETVGAVTRAAESPCLVRPVALALVDFDLDVEEVTVAVDPDEGGEADGATGRTVDLPFVKGSDRSARLPRYPEA